LIEFSEGEVKELDVQLTAIAPPEPAIAISELFIGTKKRSWETGADCGFYIQLRNLGDFEVSGTVLLYDWQAWWGNPPGDERRWVVTGFTLAPGGIFRCHDKIHQLAFDNTYIRVAVVVNEIVIAESRRIYYIPGKKYTGSERIALGECTHKEPGHFVLWYSQYGMCRSWYGSYRTPPLPAEYVQRGSFGRFRTDEYDSASWEAVFIPIFDSDIISGNKYEGHIHGGLSGGAWRECWFTFTAG
jgi:hypothetical protein